MLLVLLWALGILTSENSLSRSLLELEPQQKEGRYGLLKAQWYAYWNIAQTRCLTDFIVGISNHHQAPAHVRTYPFSSPSIADKFIKN